VSGQPAARPSPTATSDRVEAPSGPRRLILLGATGSIGGSTLDVVRHAAMTGDGPGFEIVGAAAGRDAAGLAAIAAEFGPMPLALAAAEHSGAAGLDAPAGSIWITGPDAAVELIERVARPGDLVLSAIVGVAGLRPTLAAIERGCDIALANKETLVAGGDLVMPAAAAAGVRMLPVDSEHAAIAQCLAGVEDPAAIAEIVLTASGGPFRTWSRERMASATVAEALDHPTWSMGAKTTIDSASLMNKALELVEAHHLFGVGADRLSVLVHPQSIVHGLVRLRDGSVLAQLAAPDMRTPIHQALVGDVARPGPGTSLDWASIASIQFEPVDAERFAAPALALTAIRRGGTAGTVLNAANEVAVEAFLGGRLPFVAVVEVVSAVLEEVRGGPVTGLADILAADAAAREAARAHLDRFARSDSDSRSRTR
jgi:1-deoxy-D-xylulose-5-phosphate reductoisomerase